MRCYDCAHAQTGTGAGSGTAAEAVAVCRRCGAGLCAEHAYERPQTVYEPAGTGTYARSPEGRRLTCAVCHEAES